MGLFRKIAGFLGFSKEEGKDILEDNIAAAAEAAAAQNVQRRGFSVPIQVPVDRALRPILVPCSSSRDGGVQGLRWYAKRLRVDEDGDVADEFLDEILPPDAPISTEEHHRQYPKFELKYSTKPANVTNQALSTAGKILHRVEHQGRLEWL